MKFLTALIFSLFISQNAIAGCSGVSCHQVKLDLIYVADGVTYIRTNGTETDLGNCTPDSGELIRLNHNHNSADKIYALLLTAYTSKLNVNIRTIDTPNNTGACYVGYAVLENN